MDEILHISATDQLYHIDGIEVISGVVSSLLTECHTHPVGIFSHKADFFGDHLDGDDYECLKNVQIFPSDPVLQEQVTEMLSQICFLPVSGS